MRAVRGAVIAAALVAAAPICAPQLLAFPYRAEAGATTVWSEAPLPAAALRPVLDDAARRVASSPLARMPEGRRIFLTSGGWRWRWLALGAQDSFALTRATGAVVVNRSDLATNRVWNGAAIGGQRSLSAVLAHEACHGTERRRYGLTVQARTPAWLFEGYCDYVAGESSLSDADAARLEANQQPHPALVYYHGRRRVAQALAANGGDVDALFAAAR